MKFKSLVLDKFIKDARKALGDNLLGIVVYGSRIWGYANDKDSEWDVYLFLDNPSIIKIKDELIRMNPKVDIEYFCSTNEFINGILNEGAWSSYAVLLKASVTVYKTEQFKKFIRKLETIRPNKKAIIGKYIQRKDKFDLAFYAKHRLTGFSAAKWSYHSINKRLQILTYLKSDIITVDLDIALKNTKDLLDNKENTFIRETKKRTFERLEKFTSEEINEAKWIIKKLGSKIANTKI